MAVYIDDMRMEASVGTLNARWSHLMADTTDELLDFARGLGMRDEWIQHPGTVKEHFDLTESKRRLALSRGAIPIAYGSEGYALMQAKRAGIPFDLAAHRLAHPVEDDDGQQASLF